MIKRTVAGYIQITFDDQDFRRHKGGALDMIAGLKKIPPAQRSYDPETKMWLIDDSPENQEFVRNLYIECFADKNQITLFGE